MSRQSDAKAAQGYVAKPVPRTCMNCARFASDAVLPAWMQREADAGLKHYDGREYTIENFGAEKNLHCALGGFAVKKMATCDKFAPKEVA